MNLVGKSLAVVGAALLLAGCSSSQAPAAAPAVPVDQLTEVRRLAFGNGTYLITVGCYQGDRVYAYVGSSGLVMSVSGGACR